MACTCLKVFSCVVRCNTSAYLQAARDQPGHVLLLIMATCGLRRSEALGLRLDNAMLLIAAILAVVLFLSGGAGMYVKFRKEI